LTIIFVGGFNVRVVTYYIKKEVSTNGNGKKSGRQEACGEETRSEEAREEEISAGNLAPGAIFVQSIVPGVQSNAVKQVTAEAVRILATVLAALALASCKSESGKVVIPPAEDAGKAGRLS